MIECLKKTNFDYFQYSKRLNNIQVSCNLIKSLLVWRRLCCGRHLVRLVFELFNSLEIHESRHLVLQLLQHNLVSCVLFEPVIFRVQHSVNVVLVVRWTALGVHFLVVVEEVWVDLIQEPRLACDCLLHSHKRRTCDPVYESSRWPLVCEGQVEKLEHCKEGAEPINVPMLVLFCDAPLKSHRRIMLVKLVCVRKK